MIACKNCGSVDVELKKYIFKNNTIHIKMICKDCFFMNFTQKTKEVLLAVKDQTPTTASQEHIYRKRMKKNKKELRRTNINQLSLC